MMNLAIFVVVVLVLTVNGQDFDIKRMITLEGQAAEEEVEEFGASK